MAGENALPRTCIFAALFLAVDRLRSRVFATSTRSALKLFATTRPLLLFSEPSVIESDDMGKVLCFGRLARHGGLHIREKEETIFYRHPTTPLFSDGRG